jgi:hypothetical protein
MGSRRGEARYKHSSRGEREKEKRGWRVYRVLALSPWRRDGDGNDDDYGDD